MSTNLDRYLFGLYNSGTYGPANEDITAISQANPCVVTTSAVHSFAIGNQVQFLIPPLWGMTQLDGLKGYIIAIPTTTQITVDIDTTAFDPFMTPVPPANVVIDNPQVAAVGNQNFNNITPGNSSRLSQTIEGAYTNQPP